ncbi:MAG: Ig-like domain-containing protein [Pseudomonadota bacterium]|nr:Ig-like domain-containing protein [Pseudomonadota bacterium]
MKSFLRTLYVSSLIFTGSGSAADDPFLQDEQGVISMEAENFGANIDRGVSFWQQQPDPSGGDASGDTMQALPDDGVQRTNAADSPQLDFPIVFNRTGTHHIWVRGYGTGKKSDSILFELDGVALDNLGFGTGALRWKGRSALEVTSAGAHTINVWMREDGVYVDKIVVGDGSGDKPSGVGPPESPQNAPGGGNVAPVASDDSAAANPDVAETLSVLANDADSDGSLAPATVSIIDSPANGLVFTKANGKATYTANAGFNGTDTFTYSVNDDLGATSNRASRSLPGPIVRN